MSTRLYALLGYPVSHSLSPAMYAAAFQALSLDARYDAFDVRPEDLARRLTELHDAGYEGLNLTAPLKTAVLDMVECAPGHRRKGSLNTLKRRGVMWDGYSTDGDGLILALKHDLSVSPEETDVIILGAGGAAQAAAISCLDAGCSSLWAGARSVKALLPFARRLVTLYDYDPRLIYPFDLNDLPSDLPSSAIIINATSCGMKPDDPAPIDLGRFSSDAKVYDMVYAHDTALLRQARALGLKCCDGRSMLLYQGVGALEIWMGRQMDKSTVDAMRAAIRAE